MRLASLTLFTALWLAPATAGATWSIVAADEQTQEVGIAGASCVAGFGPGVPIPVTGLVPGVGVIAAQALVSDSGRDRGVRRLREGRTPADVLLELTNGAFDPDFQQRQYGVVALTYEPAAFTGSDNQPTALAALGDEVNVAVQGNTLRADAVVTSAFETFKNPALPCPTLADRLIEALEAGGAAGGDNRCSAEQTALIAWLEVARPQDQAEAPYLQIIIPSQPEGGDDPVALLREQYDQWRAANPPDPSQCGGTTGGNGGSSGTPATTSAGDTSSAGTDTSAATTVATSTSTATESTTAAATNTAGGAGDDGGCGCRRSGASPPWLLLLLLVVGSGPRRRR